MDIERICQYCKKVFKVTKWYLRHHPAKYCSMSCRGKTNPPFKIGIIPPPHKLKCPCARCSRKAPITAFKKGSVPWNKGIKRPQMSGENHPQWRGGTYDKDRKIDWGRKFSRDWRKAVLERDDYKCT